MAVRILLAQSHWQMPFRPRWLWSFNTNRAPSLNASQHTMEAA